MIALAKKYPEIAKECLDKRPLLKYAINRDSNRLKIFLTKEEEKERQKDRQYWLPLKKELEKLRRKRII